MDEKWYQRKMMVRNLSICKNHFGMGQINEKQIYIITNCIKEMEQMKINEIADKI